MNFGEFLESNLAKKHISKSEFARSIGVSRATLATNIMKWKEGRQPNLETMRKYMDGLGLNLKKFF